MQITTITVSSSRKLPHPNADFASVSGLVSLEARLGEDDSPSACTAKLQAQADALVEKHMDSIAARLRQRAAEAHQPKQATATAAARLAEKHGAKS